MLEVTEVRRFYVVTREAGDELLASRVFERLASSCERLLVVVNDAAAPPQQGEPPRVLTVRPGRSVAPAFVEFVTLFLSPGGLFQERESADGRGHAVMLGLDDLDERSLQIPFFILHLLHAATTLLMARLSARAKPSLFFSHAKQDGVPLARGARMWLERLPGFSGFYDTEDLDLAGDWRAQLPSVVAESILVVFRTEEFDGRYWCRQEVLWADEHHRPLVCVDARWHLQQESSLVNLASARRELDGRARSAPPDEDVVQYIVYPNPAVPEEVRKSLEALVEIDRD